MRNVLLACALVACADHEQTRANTDGCRNLESEVAAATDQLGPRDHLVVAARWLRQASACAETSVDLVELAGFVRWANVWASDLPPDVIGRAHDRLVVAAHQLGVGAR